AIGLVLQEDTTLLDSLGNEVNLVLPANDLGVSSNFVVNPFPPTTVAIVEVNSGSAQRSRLTNITLHFSTTITAATLTGLGAVTLTRTTANGLGTIGTIVQTGATGANGRITVSPASGPVSSLTLTFDNANGDPVTLGVENGSLSDGHWQLSIPY